MSSDLKQTERRAQKLTWTVERSPLGWYAVFGALFVFGPLPDKSAALRVKRQIETYGVVANRGGRLPEWTAMLRPTVGKA